MRFTYILSSFLLASVFFISACDTSSRSIGEACSEKTECASGYCLMQSIRDTATGWENGYCSAICDTDDDCPETTHCRALSDASYCLADCARDSNCRAGYVCNTVWLSCLPDCHNEGWTCGDGFSCNDNGQCVSDTGVNPDGDIGSPCTVAEECSSGMCIPAGDQMGQSTYWSEGYCSMICVDDTSCPQGAQCSQLLDAAYCLKACGTNADCRADYVCDTDWLVCLPDCRLGWPCAPGQTCDANGVCINGTQPDGDVDMPEREIPDVPGVCQTDADCNQPSMCPADAPLGCLCRPSPQGENLCVPACNTNNDCPPQQGMTLICGQEGFCIPQGAAPGGQ